MIKHSIPILFIFCFLAKAPPIYAQKASFEKLFKTAFECNDCPDSVRIALFTDAINFGSPDPKDFDNFSNALVNRGTLFMEMGEYEKAIADFSQAIDISVDLNNIRQKLGTAYLRNSEFTKAIEQYDKYIDQLEAKKQDVISRFTPDSTKTPDTQSINLNEVIRNEIIAEVDDQLAIGYNNRAIAKGHLRDHKGACADFQKAYDAGMTELKNFLDNECD